MKYTFNVSEEREIFRFETDLIPRAIEDAQKVKPEGIVKDMWEGAINRDLERHNPRFCWKNFLYGLLP